MPRKSLINALHKVTAKESFLPEWLIMLDGEFDGVVPGKNKILQIAMLRLKLDGHQYKEDGALMFYLPHSGSPSNEFQKKYLAHIFKEANQSEHTLDQAKAEIEAFLGPLRGKVMPCGDCVPTDMEFLYQNGLAVRSEYRGDEAVPGTFHFEFFELNPLKALARQKLGKKFDIPGADPNIHDALVDVRNQLLELNIYLKVLL